MPGEHQPGSGLGIDNVVNPCAGENEDIESLRRKLAAELTEEDIDWPERGASFGRLGDLLYASGKVAEAAQAYQQATDAYGHNSQADPQLEYFARKVVSCVNELWKRPADRLDLLLARLEEERRELVAGGAMPGEVAGISLKLATILHRRDRFTEAEQNYLKAISQLNGIEGEEIRLADIHKRLSGLYHYEMDRPDMSVTHYESAIALFSQFEEHSEGEQMNRKLCEELLAQARASLRGD